MLKDSGVFEYTWTELEIWLNQLARVDPNQQETVIQFLERVSYLPNRLSYFLNILIVPVFFFLTQSHIYLFHALILGFGEACEQFLHVHR